MLLLLCSWVLLRLVAMMRDRPFLCLTLGESCEWRRHCPGSWAVQLHQLICVLHCCWDMADVGSFYRDIGRGSMLLHVHRLCAALLSVGGRAATLAEGRLIHWPVHPLLHHVHLCVRHSGLRLDLPVRVAVRYDGSWQKRLPGGHDRCSPELWPAWRHEGQPGGRRLKSSRLSSSTLPPPPPTELSS